MMILIFASIFFNNQSLSAHYTKTLVFLWHTYVIFSIKDGINVCMIQKNASETEKQYEEYAAASQLSDVIYI